MSPTAAETERAHVLACDEVGQRLAGVLSGAVGRLLGSYEHRLWWVLLIGEVRSAMVMRGATRPEVIAVLRDLRKLGSISRYLASTAEIEDEPTPVERHRGKR